MTKDVSEGWPKNEQKQRFPLKWDGPTRLNENARINTYCDHRILEVVNMELKKCGMLDRFRASCFGHFLRYDSNVVFNEKIFLSLMSTEVVVPDGSPYVRHFDIGNRRCSFSKLEYCMFSGLRFGASLFNPEATHQIPEEGIYNRRWPNQSVVACELESDFELSKFNENPEDALKVAYILVATLYLFARDERTPIYNWMWALVEDETAFNNFPWGACAFQRSMLYLDRGLQPSVNQSVKKLYHLYGYILPLQLWAFECFPELGAALGDRKNDELPRGARWKCPEKHLNIPALFHRHNILVVDVYPTPDERKMPYMVDIEMDLSTDIYYVHHDRSIVIRGPIGKRRRLIRSNTIRAQVEARKRALVETDDDLPPRPFVHSPPTGSLIPSSSPLIQERSILRDMINDILREVLPEVMREVLPVVMKEVLSEVTREVLPEVVREVLPEVLRDINPHSQDNINSPLPQEFNHKSAVPEGHYEFSPIHSLIRCPSPQHIEDSETASLSSSSSSSSSSSLVLSSLSSTSSSSSSITSLSL